VKRAQKLGFTLGEIQELMKLENPDLHIEHVRKVAHAKIREIDEKMKALKQIRRSLARMLKDAATREATCPVLEEDQS
jgi:DNA-binding transcriptional MerR regulator